MESRWEALKEQIRVLYLVEDRSRAEVSRVLETEHGVKATKAQYETQFNKWGFRKNLTADEWGAVTHQIKKRKREGKDSSMYLGGLLMKPTKVRKGVSRYRSATMELIEECDGTKYGKATSPRLPGDVIISTPAASPGSSAPIDDPSTPYCIAQVPDQILENSITLDSLLHIPFFQFQVLYNEEILKDTNLWNPRANTVANFHDLQNSVVSYFKEPNSPPNTSRLSHSRLMALMPSEMLDWGYDQFRASELQIAPITFGNFMNSLLFMISNKIIAFDSDMGLKVYQWFKQHTGSDTFVHMMAIGGPTAYCLSEQLAAIAIEDCDAKVLAKILESGFEIKQWRYRDKHLNLVTPLQRACKLLSLDVIRVLLDSGVDIDGSTPDTPVPLVCAIKGNSEPSLLTSKVEVIQMLLRAGASVNIGNKTPLMVAVSWGEPQLVEMLLFAGADPNAADETGSNVIDYIRLRQYFISNTIQILELLSKAGTSFENETVDSELLPGFEEVFRFFLIKRAYVPPQAVSQVIKYEQVDLLKSLLDYGIHVSPNLLEDLLDDLERFVDDHDYYRGDPSTFRLLFSATKSYQNDEHRELAFCIAIYYGDKGITQALASTVLAQKPPTRLRHALEAAALSDDVETFQILLKNDLLWRESLLGCLGDALCAAIQKNNRELIDLLLNAGVDMNVSELDSGKTPLYYAIEEGNIPLATQILAVGGFVNTKRLSRELFKKFAKLCSLYTASVLPAAAKLSDIVFLRYLIGVGADVNGLEPELGTTALTTAIEQGDHEIVRFLIEEAGADINTHIPSFLGKSALAVAVRKNDVEVIRYLVTMGADPDEWSLIEAVKKSGAVLEFLLASALTRHHFLPRMFGSRALKLAASSGSLHATKMLLSKGVNGSVIVPTEPFTHFLVVEFQHRYCKGGDSPFSMALQHDRGEGFPIIKAFLAAGTDPNLDFSENWKLTPLQYALKMANQLLARLLIAAGADTNLQVNNAGSSLPLQLAVKKCDMSTVELLLEKGADINAPASDKSRATALQLASKRGDMEIVKLLLERGADVNAPAYHKSGATALQYASFHSHLGIVKVLLDRGAHIDAPPARINGRTALEGAAENGRIDVLAILLEHGATYKKLTSEQYDCACDMASSNGHMAVRRLLDVYRKKL